MDVVPVGELSMWNSDPWQVIEKDGKLFGRGVEDNQQGLVSSIFAVLSLIKNNVTPKYNVKLLFVADEEVGSNYGIQYLLENYSLFSKDDMVIIPDGGDSLGKTIEIAEKDFTGLCFVNLVDFDMVYGHRRDVDGYAKALNEFDKWLNGFIEMLGDDDAVIITADHGCDPSFSGTDHTREYVPFMLYGKAINPENLGTVKGFDFISKTVVNLLKG
jgi:hypothetical protein